MNGYLIAEEGPLDGITLAFEGGGELEEWSLGRDPETSNILLEDPMVSRKHATVRRTSTGLILENLSTVNPVTQNGKIVVEPVLLKEGDIIEIGSTFFRFTERASDGRGEIVDWEVEDPPLGTPPSQEDSGEVASEIHFGAHPETRWLLKVVSGPNTGAEFAMYKSSTYLLGKDPNICDIVFQDLSVSRQHARLTIDQEENLFIEDLGSRNGCIINGELLADKQMLRSEDLVALGTTSFLVVDRLKSRETLFSPPMTLPSSPNRRESIKQELAEKRDWKALIIPKRHLAIAGIFGALLFSGLFGLIALFKSEPIAIKQVDEVEKVRTAIEKFPGVQFSFNNPSQKLFLSGHVLTTIDHQELLYLVAELPFVDQFEDNVIVDELIWQNTNALLSRNPAWVGVSLYGPNPGLFVLRGYVPSIEERESLIDYMNRNFNYLDRLESQVIVEKNLQTEIDGLLLEHGLLTVAFELSNGEVVFSGRIDEKEGNRLKEVIFYLQKVPGIQSVKNYVAVTHGDTSRADISKSYQVTGYSKRDDADFYVVINGKILGQGDQLDGMMITQIKHKAILLEREGFKYKIDYNIQ